MNVYVLKNIVDQLNEWSKELKDFILSNAKSGPFENPLFWVGAFCLGIALFMFTYSALQKEK